MTQVASTTVKIAPFSLDVDIRFVHVPRSPCLTTSFGSQLIGDQRGKPSLPVSNGLMREHKAALQNHFSQITQAQLVPQPPQHDEEDDIGGIFERVERSACTLGSGTSDSPVTFSWSVPWLP
jgi:hypothetical protein